MKEAMKMIRLNDYFDFENEFFVNPFATAVNPVSNDQTNQPAKEKRLHSFHPRRLPLFVQRNTFLFHNVNLEQFQPDKDPIPWQFHQMPLPDPGAPGCG